LWAYATGDHPRGAVWPRDGLHGSQQGVRVAFDKVMWFQKAISAIYIYWFRGNCGAPSGSSSFGGKETLKRVDFHLFIVAFLASGLGAYTLFGLPYQWLAFAIVLAALAVAVVTRTLTLPPPGLIPYLVLFA